MAKVRKRGRKALPPARRKRLAPAESAVARLRRELAEARAQQAATAEILKVISGSPTDTQPVFDDIAEHATQLCGGKISFVFMFDGDWIHLAAVSGMVPEGVEAARQVFPMRPGGHSVAARTIRDGTVVHVPDVLADPDYLFAETSRVGGFRSVLGVPMLREGRIVGGIAVARAEVGLFLDKRVELLKTFADQAVIAIENVRLFNETREALERQTATAEILRVISGSPTDVQPVFDAIVETAKRLIGAFSATVTHVDAGMLRLVAHTATTPEGAEALNKYFPIPVEGTSMGRAILLRRPEFIDDFEADTEDARDGRELARSRGFRSVVFVPLMRGGIAIGSLNVTRREPGRMSGHQIDLLKTFADQAVIAIENVRLFKELEASNRDVTEALERQTATAEILKVISSSPTDVQPVLDAIVQSGARLFPPCNASIMMREGELIHLRAVAGPSTGNMAEVQALFPIPFEPKNIVAAKAMVDREIIQIPDTETLNDTRRKARAVARAANYRSLTMVPLVREGQGIGAIALTHPEPGYRLNEKQLALVQTFADQAVIAIENVRLFNETKEALERQTATAEILNVIASSPSDVQPVFDAIAESARRLIGGLYSVVTRKVGDALHLAASTKTTPEGDAALQNLFPTPITGQGAMGKAVMTRSPVAVEDVETDPAYSVGFRAGARARGMRSMLCVPMLREEEAIGVLSVNRAQPGPFSEHQTNLLKTFADQAVIAIENVRLFNETKEALERQTATAEILKVISQSTTDVQPVLVAIVRSAARLFPQCNAFVFMRDGGLVRLRAMHGVTVDESLREDLGRVYPVPFDPTVSSSARAMAERRSNACADTEAPDVPEHIRRAGRAARFRSNIVVPLVRDDEGIGTIVLTDPRPGHVLDGKQLALLQTFADQAVIAIENVRLFNETKEALERQTATAEILRVIASSPSDVQPVFDAIVGSALRLMTGSTAHLARLEGDTLNLVAFSVTDAEGGEALKRLYPVSIAGVPAAKVLADQVAWVIEDVETDPDLTDQVRTAMRARGVRSSIRMPMVSRGRTIGILVVARKQAGLFSKHETELLKTFADQAVIAIENVRLFKELESRTEALSKSVGQLTALGEVGQAISSTLDLETVLKTIVARAVQLTGLDGGSMYEYDEAAGEFRLQAAENIEEQLVKAVREVPVKKGEGAIGQTAITLEPAQVADIRDASYRSGRKELLVRSGYRGVLAVPLVREGRMLGALQVFRRTPGEFGPEIVELLKTFASQSAMAIQNARLFREIAEKGKQLEVASRHKSDFLASMSHELRTPLNAILGFNEMILGQVYGEVPADMQEPLEDIQKSGKHLLRLINNVLDLAKIEAGRMELSLQDYSVHDTVESVRATLRPLAAEKGLEFLVTLPQDLPLAYGDSGRIAQCLMNLAGNSLKFTKAGRVEIRVVENGGLLNFRVVDTGIGIPPDKIGSLFTEFRQTDATIASEYGGTGLGLSISKKFVEMHGGRIWIESELGKGSEFIFEIPLRVKTP